MLERRLHPLRARRAADSLGEEDVWARLAVGSLFAAPIVGLLTGLAPLVMALIGGAVLAEGWAVVLRVRSALRDEV